MESMVLESLPGLHHLFNQVIQQYASALHSRRALDFDDLESGALRLLSSHTYIRQRWQAEISAILVDEFQDTNQRQRQLIDLIGGDTPGRRFYVGDDRQSIYRFRGADVTVFREVRRQVEVAGGLVINLDTTYRTHAPLVAATSSLLEPAMRSPIQPMPDYWVNFTHLQAFNPDSPLPAPYLEFLAGADRPIAASLLAQRLLELYVAGEITSWDQVALLFRASTHFNEYETALQTAGIPFVTVAGRGFYQRPEIRDLLNQLRALANPWDDAALAGLLRSPAFGLSDEVLYRLRWPNPGAEASPLFTALHNPPENLTPAELAQVKRAASLLDELSPLVDRLPVAELLARLLDRTDLRAILAFGGARLVQNVDKLLADAHTSRIVPVRTFLSYVDTLRDIGAREGEAPVEAAGAVQLLTIHRAKGLEFDIVVLADASYRSRNRSTPAFWLPAYGFAAAPNRLPDPDAVPLAYAYLKYADGLQEEAERVRLLYVALTRARQRLLVSGHLSRSSPYGWLKTLCDSAGLDLKNNLPETVKFGIRTYRLANPYGCFTATCLMLVPLRWS
jgi:ATP-dependent helicase/nuclease subunit A